MQANILMPAYSETDVDCIQDQMPQSDNMETLRAWRMARDHVCSYDTDVLMKEAQTWPKPRAELARDERRESQSAEDVARKV